MNQTQKNYMKKRVEGIRRIKESEIRKHFTTKAVQLTHKEMRNLIRKREVKMFPESKIKENYNGGYINSVFDFSKYTTKQKFEQKKCNEVMKRFNAQSNALLDEIMLGDCEAALDMIKELEAFSI